MFFMQQLKIQPCHKHREGNVIKHPILLYR